MRATESRTKAKSRATNTASAGRNDSSGTRPSTSPASSGTISMRSRVSRDNCVSTSKVRMKSMSSPKKSMRNGNSQLYE